MTFVIKQMRLNHSSQFTIHIGFEIKLIACIFIRYNAIERLLAQQNIHVYHLVGFI